MSPLAPLPIRMVRRDDYSEASGMPPGSFIIERDDPESASARLYYRCPGNEYCSLGLSDGEGRQRTDDLPAIWKWDGDEDKPTLHPSINCHHCGWHGWIKAGVIS